jgi:hypothetical protein
LRNSIYLCHRIQVQHSDFSEKDEKGTPLKSEAVPAAVSPGCIATIFTELQDHCPDVKSGWEGISKRDEPEDLPDKEFVEFKLRDKA